MKKQLALLLILLFILNTMSGCSSAFGFDSQNLMSPPKSNSDQQAIYALMENSEGSVNFVYPKNGEYRSAIISKDFTGDGVKDAVGFTSDSETGGCIAEFLTKKNGNWEIIGSFKNSSAQVDRVCFSDLTGDGRSEIVIGWGSVQSLTATASVYYYSSNGIIESTIASPYSELCCADMDGDGREEIFTAGIYTPAETENDADSDAVGTVYDCSMGKALIQYSTVLNNSVTRYISAQYTSFSSGYKGIALEGTAADGSYLSQIICVSQDGASLYTPLARTETEKSMGYFRRPAGFSILPTDVNNDGFMDFPLLSLLPGHDSTETGSDAYLVSWIKFYINANQGETVQKNIYNISENYRLTLSADSDSAYTCFVDQNSRELRLNYVETGIENRIIYSKRLFVIKVFSHDSWNELSSSGGSSAYRKLPIASSDAVYAVSVNEESEDTEKIISSFSLINN